MQVPVEILWGIAAFVASKLFEWVYNALKKQSDVNEKTVSDLITGLKQNTEAVLELNYEIKNLKEKIISIPKLEKDISEAHIKIRELRSFITPLEKGEF